MKRRPRRTCPYPWLAVGWPELLAVKLASDGGGRDLPERKKATTRGGSEGSAASRRHQRIPKATPERLLEPEGHRSKVAGLRRSPEISGRGRRPEACPAGLRCSYVVVAVVRSGVRLGSEERGSIYSRSEKGVTSRSRSALEAGERR